MFTSALPTFCSDLIVQSETENLSRKLHLAVMMRVVLVRWAEESYDYHSPCQGDPKEASATNTHSEVLAAWQQGLCVKV